MIIVTGFTDLSAEAHRNQTAALLATTQTLDANGTPLGLVTVGGIHSGFATSKTGPLAGVIQAGRAIIPATDPTQGAYVVVMTEPEPFALEPGDGVYNRQDLICLQMEEVPEIDPEDPEPPYVAGAKIVVVKGTGVTGTTVPATPATPPNAIPLWSIRISAGMTEANGGYSPTTNIFDLRTRLKLANQDRQAFSQAAGIVQITCTANSYYAFTGVNFPAGRFRVAPIVMATLNSAANGTAKTTVRALNVTPTGCSFYVYTGDGGNFGVNHNVMVAWTATQMSEDKAAG